MRQFRLIDHHHSPTGVAIQAQDLDSREMQAVQCVIGNSYMDSKDYQTRVACSAFLQGQDDSGWILIEFWNDNYQAMKDFCQHLQDRVNSWEEI